MGIILVRPRHFTTNHVLVVAVATHKHQIDVSPFASLKYTQPRDHRAVQSCSSHQFLRELRQPRESEHRAVTRFYFSTPPTTRELHLSPFQFATPMSIRLSSLCHHTATQSTYQTPAQKVTVLQSNPFRHSDIQSPYRRQPVESSNPLRHTTAMQQNVGTVRRITVARP